MPKAIEPIDEVNQGKGWSVLPTIQREEITIIHSGILDCFNSALTKNNLGAYTIKDFSEMAKYHQSPLARRYHNKLWSKRNRVLNNASANEVTDLFKEILSGIFRSFEVSDEERLGFGNIYWRLVRPNAASDVGAAHRDSWFWEISPNQTMPPGKTTRYKVWIPLIISEGVNSLSFYSYSQLNKNLKWSTNIRDGQEKPFLVGDDISTKLVVANCQQGQPILFHDDTIHKGPINTSNTTRVSLEFTLCVNETDLP